MKKSFFANTVVAALLAISTALMLNPSRAKAADGQAATTEVRVDNFTFGPDTLTVPVNATVTWIIRTTSHT